MTEFKDLKISIGNKGSTWIAATGRSPYFCFVAESREAVLAKARGALEFYCLALKR
jgi:predicted RNase H-like HicB family nuclease